MAFGWWEGCWAEATIWWLTCWFINLLFNLLFRPQSFVCKAPAYLLILSLMALSVTNLSEVWTKFVFISLYKINIHFLSLNCRWRQRITTVLIMQYIWQFLLFWITKSESVMRYRISGSLPAIFHWISPYIGASTRSLVPPHIMVLPLPCFTVGMVCQFSSLPHIFCIKHNNSYLVHYVIFRSL